MDRYYDDIYNFCCYHSGNREDAYDLAQETFLRFIRYVGQYKYVNLKGYLLTVAMNVCRNYYRDKKEETDRTAGEQEAPEDAIHREYPPGKYSGQDGYSRLEYCMVLKKRDRQDDRSLLRGGEITCEPGAGTAAQAVGKGGSV